MGRLTPRQQTALALLARRGATSAVDRNAWWPLLDPDSGQVYGILARLERRGLVEARNYEFDSRNHAVRLYGITTAGLAELEAVEADLDALLDGDDE